MAMMFVGYPYNCEEDSVRMWNPGTNGVVTTRDVIWLKRMFYKMSNQTAEAIPLLKMSTKLEGEAADEVEIEVEENVDVDAGAGEDAVEHTPATITRFGREVCQPERFIEMSYLSLDGTAADLRYLSNLAEIDNTEARGIALKAANIEVSLVGAGVGGGFGHTSEIKVVKYKEAMARKDAKDWIDEINNEKETFKKYNAVTPVLRSLIPRGSKIMTST